MSSIMTNTGAISALNTLRGIDRNMSATQTRVATGLDVATASDNAAYWSITTTMRSDDKAMAAVQDALSLGAATVDVAYTGMSQAIDVMSEFKAKLVAAREPGVDRGKINSELTELRAQMRSIAENSSFNGVNLLTTEDGTTETDKEIVGSFIRDSNGSVRVGTMTYPVLGDGGYGSPTRLIDNGPAGMSGILTQPAVASGLDVVPPYLVFLNGDNPIPDTEEIAVTASTSNDEIDLMIDQVEYMSRQLAEAGALLGAMAAKIEDQSSYLADLRATNTKGVGRLRDADMNEQSARLKAMQTQKQLGLQSLSIANSNAENIVSLFR